MSLRDDALMLFNEILPEFAEIIVKSCNNAAISEAQSSNIAAIWENTAFSDIFGSIVQRVSINLDPQSSINNSDNSLINAIRSGKSDPTRIGFMTSEELNPMKNEHIREEIRQREKQEVKPTVSHAHVCRKCRGNSTTSRRMQMRCLDEGYSYLITCQDCENEWSIS